MKILNRILCVSLSCVLALSVLSGCGKKTASQTGENIVQKTENTQTESGEERNYEVQLDERTEETQYQYAEDDLALVDTVSGKKISLGMTEQEVEAIAGEPMQKDLDYRVYDGVVVRYIDGAAASMIVASGQFEGEKATRFVTTRGIKIGTTVDDFKKAYGDSYAQGEERTDEKTGETYKVAGRAVRYFEKNGNKIKYIGTELPDDKKDADTSNYYFQDFMFSNKDGSVTTIRITLMDAAMGGK